MTKIPTLTTARTLLRPMRYADWEAYAALMLSERARYMGGPFTKPVAWGMFCADHAQWDFCGAGALMIEARETGESLGQISLTSGPIFPELELGWIVYPAAEGQGYAFEAAAAMRDHVRDVLKLPTLVSCIDAENIRSIRLAERLGAVRDDAAPRSDPTDLVYRHFIRS